MQLFLNNDIFKLLAIYSKASYIQNKVILNVFQSNNFDKVPMCYDCNFTQENIIFEIKKKNSVQIFFTHPLGIVASLFSWDGSKS